MGPYSLQTQVLVVVGAVTLRKYIKQEARSGWLSEKYNSKKLIVIDSYDEDEDDETMAGFMPSHIDSEIDSLRDNFASLMQRMLE